MRALFLLAAGLGLPLIWGLSRRDEKKQTTGRKPVDDEIKLVVEEYKAATDPKQKAALKVKLDAEIERRRVAEAKAPKPLYPVGLLVRFGKREATITAAQQSAAGPIYTIDLKTGEFLGLGSGVYTRTEADIRKVLADEVRAPLAADQAFPAGVAVYRNGQGGLIEKAEKTGAGWVYTVKGWPRPVGQDDLLSVLRK